MDIYNRIQKIIDTPEKSWSAICVLIITLIIVTPLCGFLFQCGCDWPWLGLDTKCNINNPNAMHQCPWCASTITGILSTGFAIIAGSWSSTAATILKKQQPVNEITTRTIFGVLGFVLVAMITGGLAALWQGYPLGVGRFLM